MRVLRILAMLACGLTVAVAGAVSAQTFTPEFSRLALKAPEPQQPIAGQPAQLGFTVAVGAPSGLRAPVVEEELAKRLVLMIDEKPVRVPSGFSLVLEETPELATNYVAEGTLTFTWPRDPAAAFGITSNEAQVVELGDREDKMGPVRRVVTVRTDTSSRLPILLLSMGIVLLSAYFIVRRWRRRSGDPVEETATADAASAPDAAVETGTEIFAPKPEAASPTAPMPLRRETEPLAVPEALVAATAARQAVVVVGAEVSVQAGGPSADALVLALLKRLGSDLPASLAPLVQVYDSPDALRATADRLGGMPKLLEALVTAAPREGVIELIAEMTPERPGALHSLLAQIPWRAVVDLNIDGLMGTALLRAQRPEDAPLVATTINDTVELPQALRAADQILLLPTGEIHRPNTVTLTSEEMRRALSRSPDFQRALSALLQSQPFLFVGVAPDAIEQFFYAAGTDLEGIEPHHFALVPDDPANTLRVSTLARFGVQLISYDAAPEAPGARQFLRALLSRARRSDLLAPANSEERSLLAPDRVSRIKLENIGPFESLELNIVAEPDSRDVGQESRWWVLFGGNGVGKSSVLRALALALAGDAPNGANIGSRLLRTGASHGLIEVQLGMQTLRTRLLRDRSTVVVSSAQQTPVQLGNALVLGFPALRGARAADPTGPNNHAELREPEPADLQALISGDVDGRLADFKQWLVNTLVKADRDPRAAEMRSLLDHIIREIVPGRVEALVPLAPGDFVIRVRTPEGEIPFDDLSQGMASIFNWVGLLVQRLFSICERSERPQDEPAVVIIDEIDAHLHPDWQRRLVHLTRRFFPNLQIIATSHSPLLAGSLRKHEMCVLGRDPETDLITIIPHSETYGLTSQDILTSGVFAMPTDRNPEVEDLVQRYFKLFEAAELTAPQKVELKQLRGALEHYGYGFPVMLAVPDEARLEKINQRFGSAGEAAA